MLSLIPPSAIDAARSTSTGHGCSTSSPSPAPTARLTRLLASWARVDVLVNDDFLLRPLTPDQGADLLEVTQDRAQLHSTVVTSQLPVAHWHEAIGEATVADVILDRLLQNAHRIELSGRCVQSGSERNVEIEHRDPARALYLRFLAALGPFACDAL